MFKEVPIINTINMQHDSHEGRGGALLALARHRLNRSAGPAADLQRSSGRRRRRGARGPPIK